jgi:flagellar basal body-associated protein FliL
MGVNNMFNKNKKSVRIISGIIIILLVLAMLASVLLYLI